MKMPLRFKSNWLFEKFLAEKINLNQPASFNELTSDWLLAFSLKVLLLLLSFTLNKTKNFNNNEILEIIRFKLLFVDPNKPWTIKAFYKKNHTNHISF